METKNIVPILEPTGALLELCCGLESAEDYRSLQEGLLQAFQGTDPTAAHQRLESPNPEQQAKAFLQLVGCESPPDPKSIKAALLAEEEELFATAAFCFTVFWADEEDFQRELLLSGDRFKPPEISENSRYALVQCMGFSGKPGFCPVLWEILANACHFYNAFSIADAIRGLGDAVGIEKHPSLQSVSVMLAQSNGELLVGADDRFGGRSSCPGCRYFPCRINEYHPGGIEDCNLWNRTDPAEAGAITEQRPGKAVFQDSQEPRFDAEGEMKVAGGLIAERRYLEAIPILSRVLILADKTALVGPAWVRLSLCLGESGEEKLAFIARREGHIYEKIFPRQKFAHELAMLEGFENVPVARFADLFLYLAEQGADRERRPGNKAVTYKRGGNGFYTAALDRYVDKNLLTSGEGAGNWFEMGGCHRELEEWALAGLFMRQGARRSREKRDGTRNYAEDPELTRRFTEGAELVRRRAERYGTDPGLAVERRRREREVTDLPSLFRNPVLWRGKAEDPDAERGYWLALLAESSLDDLAYAVLGRMRFERTGRLLDLERDLRDAVSVGFLRAAERTFDEVQGGHDSEARKKLHLFEVIDRGLEVKGQFACSMVIYAYLHDDLASRQPSLLVAEYASPKLSLVQLRILLGQALARAGKRWAQAEDLAALARSTRQILDEIEPTDDVSEEDLQDLQSWLSRWQLHVEAGIIPTDD